MWLIKLHTEFLCACLYTFKNRARAGPGLENLPLPSGRAGPGLELTGPGRAGPNNISAAVGPGRAGLKVHGPGPGRAQTFRPVEHSTSGYITFSGRIQYPSDFGEMRNDNSPT